MKRLINCIVALFFMLTMFCNGVSADDKVIDCELQRAVTMGFGEVEEGEIAYEQFFKLLDHSVEIIAPDKLSKWKTMHIEARRSKNVITRQEAMLVTYYAAKLLGEDYLVANCDWGETHRFIGESCWDEIIWEYSLFSGWKSPAVFDGDEWNDHMTAAYFHSFGRVSLFSNKSLFDLDQISKSMRLNDNLTYREAILVAIRLYDSNTKTQCNRIITTEAEEKLINEININKEKIMNSETEVRVRGKKYYVSNRGDDRNDGLSPNKAWATLKKVNTTKLRAGDGVFFERGGLWRSNSWKDVIGKNCGNGVLYAQDGVIYSAYGEGDKPSIFGSPENGADKNKWKLLEGTKNIWVFYKDMQDCGGIVIEDDECVKIALKTCAYWDGEDYYNSKDGVIVDEKKVRMDVRDLENLYFFNDISYPEGIVGHYSAKGKLYLRCDKGNPGEVFKSIEFMTWNNDWNEGFASANNGCIIDNISFKYGTMGVSLGNNSTIQNCEISWSGGQMLDFSSVDLGCDTEGTIVRSGDAIVNFGDNNVVKNNYVHHIYDYGITVEGFAATGEKEYMQRENIVIKDNIVEYCFGSILIVDWYAMSKRINYPSYYNVDITGNYMVNSGYGWSHKNDGSTTGSLVLLFHPGSLNDVTVSNNVIYLSKHALVWIDTPAYNELPLFIRNTYCQNYNGVVIDRGINNQQERTYPYSIYNTAKDIEEVLKEMSPILLE